MTLTIQKRVGKGFSLLELLVVAALIGVVVAIAIPVVSSVRQSSRSVACLSKLRATGIAVLAHAGEHRGQVVLAWASNSAADLERYPQLVGHPQGGLMWHQYLRIQRYITDPKVLVCPGFYPFNLPVTPSGSQVMMTYGLRRGLGAAAYEPPAVLGKTEAPASVVLLADSSKPQSWVGQSYYFTVPGNRADTLQARHKGRANLFFLDGSVRSLSEAEILSADPGLNDRVFDSRVYASDAYR